MSSQTNLRRSLRRGTRVFSVRSDSLARTLLGLSTNVALLFLVGAANVRADWPLTRGNATSTGATEVELPENLELLWQYKIDGLGFDAGPIIVDRIVFAADADGNVMALSLDSGEELWKQFFGNGFMASPAYQDGMLVVGDVFGIIRALDPKTGQERWQFDAEHEIDGGANFFEDAVLVTSQGGSLLSLGRRDGSLQWRYETDDQLQCAASLAGSLTFLGGCDQHLHIVDVKTGKPATDKIPIEAPTGSTPAVHGSVVLVPNYKGQIWAFETPSNQLLWKFENNAMAGEFKNSVAVAHGIVVAASGNRRVFALDAQNGDVLWQHTLRRRVEGSPTIAGKAVVVAGSDGRVLLFDLKTGEQKWTFDLKGSFLGSPAVSDGKLVVASDRGEISCFGAK